VNVGSSFDEIKKFRRWKEALEYARKKAAQTGEQATIQDTGRDEWSKPFYDVWARPKASDDEKAYASGIVDSSQITTLLSGIQAEGGDHEYARQVLERVLTERDVPWTWPLYFVETTGVISSLRRRLRR